MSTALRLFSVARIQPIFPSTVLGAATASSPQPSPCG
jgi:hypothetical protein